MRKYSWNVHKKEVHMFNMWTTIMQSLNKIEGKLMELQILHKLGIPRTDKWMDWGDPQLDLLSQVKILKSV